MGWLARRICATIRVLSPDFQLSFGSHDASDPAMCIMEAVAYVAGENRTDQPSCTCPVLTSFCIGLNDSMNDVERQQLLPYVTRLVGTRTGDLNVMTYRAQIASQFAQNMTARAAAADATAATARAATMADATAATARAATMATAAAVRAARAADAAADVAAARAAARAATARAAAHAAAHAAATARAAAAAVRARNDIWTAALRCLDDMLIVR